MCTENSNVKSPLKHNLYDRIKGDQSYAAELQQVEMLSDSNTQFKTQ